ncbi:hypothetical protein HK102_011498 [Quaeritorhiza haematococci]|nr:hypothetical protein HK102_011498 [Quaeritorhiza haematococci]
MPISNCLFYSLTEEAIKHIREGKVNIPDVLSIVMEAGGLFGGVVATGMNQFEMGMDIAVENEENISTRLFSFGSVKEQQQDQREREREEEDETETTTMEKKPKQDAQE